ncbi:MAG: YhjD/YihY/BrkB family envelope integrity protein [Solirubrobacterales bacterium]
MRLEQERERRLVVALGFAIVDRGRRAAASVLAGALAFRFFLTLLPLTLVAVVGLGYLSSAGGTPSDAVREFGIKGALAASINDSASVSDPGRTVVLLLGIVGLLAGARTTTATLRAIHALAWGIPVERWRRTSTAALVFLGAVVVTIASAGLAARARADAGVALGFGASALLAVIGAALWLGASWLLPHREGIRWTALLPGAVLVGVGLALLQAVTANWIGPKLHHQSKLYGSLGVSFVVLGWLYVVGRLLVAAPLLNAALLDHRRSPPTSREFA